MSIFVEWFAGSCAVGLALVGGSRVVPPIGYMGGKRRMARDILGAFGLRPGDGCDHLVLVDAGPWGEAWQVIFDAELRPALVARLRSWRGEDPSDLWERLRDAGRPADLVERVAAWLWLQGRSASCTPLWWDEAGAVVMANNGALPPRGPSQKDLAPFRRTALPVQGLPSQRGAEAHVRSRGAGMRHVDTVADRIEAIGALRIPRVTVLRSHAELEALGLRGANEYLDPPYQGCTRYAALCSRDEVLDLSLRRQQVARHVVVSEAVPLPLPGWHALQLPTRRPEWLTCSHPPAIRPAVQLALWATAPTPPPRPPPP